MAARNLEFSEAPTVIQDCYRADEVIFIRLTEWDDNPNSVIMVRLKETPGRGVVHRWQLTEGKWLLT